MPQNQECNLCHLVQCVSVEGQRSRLEYLPWMPWVKPESVSVNDCPIRRDPQNHTREINKYRLPEIKMPY